MARDIAVESWDSVKAKLDGVAQNWRNISTLSARPILERADKAKPGESEASFATVDDMFACVTTYTRQMSGADGVACMDTLKTQALAELELENAQTKPGSVILGGSQEIEVNTMAISAGVGAEVAGGKDRNTFLNIEADVATPAEKV